MTWWALSLLVSWPVSGAIVWGLAIHKRRILTISDAAMLLPCLLVGWGTVLIYLFNVVDGSKVLMDWRK